MKKKTIIGNVCFVIDQESHKILLLKRAKEPMANMFTGVGGKTNFDENISSSCAREVKEETGLTVENLKLKGVIKTVLEGRDSSWVLFVYTAEHPVAELKDCSEGELQWVSLKEIYSYSLIGFIKVILPHILEENEFVEGLIRHDTKGNVLEQELSVRKLA